MTVKVTFDPKSKTFTITGQYDPDKAYPASKSGKTAIVATTSGFVSIPGTLAKASLNVTAPKAD